MMSIKKQIEKYCLQCKKAGLKQVEVCQIIGITPSALCNYRRGDRPIRAEHFERLRLLAKTKTGQGEPAA
jgi:predicted transcriptional regulator